MRGGRTWSIEKVVKRRAEAIHRLVGVMEVAYTGILSVSFSWWMELAFFWGVV